MVKLLCHLTVKAIIIRVIIINKQPSNLGIVTSRGKGGGGTLTSWFRVAMTAVHSTTGQSNTTL